MSRKPVVLVTENVDGPPLARLESWCDVRREPAVHREPAALLRLAAQADALIVRNETQVTRELLAHAPRLAVVARAGVGLDNIDVEAAEELGIVVTSAREENAISVAEMTVGLILALARRLVPADAAARSGRWDRWSFIGTELYGKTLGLLGLGRIGVRVAVRLRAFGMSILAYDPFLRTSHPFVTESGARLVSLAELLERADVISVHLPYTPATRHLLDAAAFQKVRPGALIVNTARGRIIDEAALIDALRSGRVAGAALDVRADEPPAVGELETFPNVILTPHIAAFTRESLARVTEVIVADVERVLRGEEALCAVGRRRPRRALRSEARA